MRTHARLAGRRSFDGQPKSQAGMLPCSPLATVVGSALVLLHEGSHDRASYGCVKIELDPDPEQSKEEQPEQRLSHRPKERRSRATPPCSAPSIALRVAGFP